jgi:pimeloyl-ACP methyl ester carboxylesterase
MAATASNLMRAVLRLMAALVAAYVAILAALFLIQRRVLYHPTRSTVDEAERQAASLRVLTWRNTAGQIIGWQWPAAATPAATVLVVHGNAGSALGRGYLAEPIRDAANADVFVLEYPGYGARGGSPAMTSILAAADDAFDSLPARVPVFVVSESLGVGPAAHLAMSRGSRIHGVLCFAPFDRLAAVAQQAAPFLAGALILRDRYDPAAWLASYHGPVVVVLAGADEMVAPKFGRRLYDGYNGRKRLLVIPGAHHNDIEEQSVDWWKDAFAFWQQ